MQFLPLFANLKDRPVLVVGGGNVAARKVHMLLQSGARVRVVAARLNDRLQHWQQQGRIQWLARSFAPGQIGGVFLIVAATDDTALNRSVYEAAEQRQKLVNVVDNPALCNFIFPAVVDRSPVQLAISSGGHAPVLARMWREKLEALLPQHLGAVASLAGRWRAAVKACLPSHAQRRAFWESLLADERFHAQAARHPAQAQTRIQAALAGAARPPAGHVTLVGAGPGDAGLLTLRGLQCLQQADVVLHDALVSPEVLALARRDAEKISVGKRAGRHSVRQHDTNRLLVQLAQSGKRVVRLKGGDPFIFGRGGEELQAVQAAGIPFEVVPGITAALGAAAYAGIPLTHRDHAQSVTFVTGHCRDGGPAPNWAALASKQQTLVVYMGALQSRELAHQLQRHGRAPDTPVAVIGQCATATQQVLIGQLQHLPSLAAQAPSPALIVIGSTVALHRQLTWFNARAAHSPPHAPETGPPPPRPARAPRAARPQAIPA